MSAFTEGFKDAMRTALATSAVCSAVSAVLASALALHDGHVVGGAFFGAGSLYLLWLSARRAWAVIAGKQDKVTP
jgi:uncharacterized membrane protein YgdD (TMEM256/DUF423 family)